MGIKRKKCEVIMLPAIGESTHIRQYGNKQGLLYLPEKLRQGHILDGVLCYHLYITSDDEIKEGDWYIANVFGEKDVQLFNYKANKVDITYLKNNCKKIIATTDKSLKVNTTILEGTGGKLIKVSNLPQPPKAFIEEYVKLGGINEVLVEYYLDQSNSITMNLGDYTPKINSNIEIIVNPIKNTN